jgi:hypothetical protein
MHVSMSRASARGEDGLTCEVRVLLDRLEEALASEVAQYFEVVIGSGSVWLAGIQRFELRHDQPGVRAVLVQISPQWRAVGLVVAVRAYEI